MFNKVKYILLSVVLSTHIFCEIYPESTSYNSNSSNTANITSIWFSEWYNDCNSAFSFSFDDNFISQYENVRPILNQFEFKGTFYVLPPFLTDSLPGIWRYGTWPMFTEMSLEGHEIGSHTMNHLHLPQLEIGDTAQEGTILYELYQSRKMINQRLPNQKCITFAYPYAEHNSLVDSLASLFYESARADGLLPNNSSFADSLWYKLNAIEVEFDSLRNSLSDDLDELQFIEDWIDSSISQNAWGILLAHEVVPQDSLAGLLAAGSYYPYSSEWFTLLCEWIQTKTLTSDIWVETVANVTRYIKERNNAHHSIIAYNELEIQLLVEDDLDDGVFNFPLSTFIKVPDAWQFVLFTQDQYTDTLEVFENDSGKVVLAKILPNNSLVTLNKIIVDEVSNQIAYVNNFNLLQNYPNPFNPSTNIQYSIADEGNVTLTVYDILGNEIAVLVNEMQTDGTYSIIFNANGLSSGVYFYTLKSLGRIETRKMLITK